ncbi:MAG: hypothetical protein H6851_07165 [Geminicoccaceae bacterium]|nr:hypothetical protein [Geminicoccaceae bacterium]
MADFPHTIDIAPDMIQRCQTGLRLGAVAARVGVCDSPADLRGELDRCLEQARERYATLRPQDQAAIAATRAAYRACGKDPSRYRPAAEALARRVAQGKGLDSINNIVDINNILSLETGLSIGTYDSGTLHGGVTLRVAGAGESYEGIGRGPLNLEGLPVLADGVGAFGSPTSDSIRSMVTFSARQLLLVVYDFGSGLLDRSLVEHACSLLVRFASADDIGSCLIDRNAK